MGTLLASFLITVTLLSSTDSEIKARAQASVSAAGAVLVQDKPEQKDCPICKGTGRVSAGDGITTVTRRCTNCIPGKREWRVIVITQLDGSCTYCTQYDNGAIKSLKDTGLWEIGPESTNHIQILAPSAQTVKDYGEVGTPTTILLHNEKEVDRVEGNISMEQLVEFHNRRGEGTGQTSVQSAAQGQVQTYAPSGRPKRRGLFRK